MALFLFIFLLLLNFFSVTGFTALRFSFIACILLLYFFFNIFENFYYPLDLLRISFHDYLYIACFILFPPFYHPFFGVFSFIIIANYAFTVFATFEADSFEYF